MSKLGYDQYQSIRFRTDHSVWADAGLAFRLQFFHVGRTFSTPVHLYEVEGGQAREILYDPAMFEWDKSGVDPATMKDHAGFAGFRVQFVTDWKADVAAFLGAAYFRAVGGDTRQYGLSARALAVDTAFPRPEEFPRFTSFWFERPAKDSGTLTLYALMDSPSIAGALRMQISPAGTLIMNVDSALYPRKPIERLGRSPACSSTVRTIAGRRTTGGPRFTILTAYPCGPVPANGSGDPSSIPRSCISIPTPTTIRAASACCSVTGTSITIRTTACSTTSARAFGWNPALGPNGGWARAPCSWSRSPTIDETFDNIVAFWNPLEKPKRVRNCCSAIGCIGARKMPYSSPLAQTIATRTGIGGTVGVKRQYYSWHFAVDFAGGELGSAGERRARRSRPSPPRAGRRSTSPRILCRNSTAIAPCST